MRYKVILIGLGAVGMGYDFEIKDPGIVFTHARAFANHQDFDLVGGVDSDSEACARFKKRYGGWAGADMEEGLRTLSPDVAVIALPTKYHAYAVQMTLLHAKPSLILCEKPLSYSLNDAREIVNACRKAACPLYVNYQRRVEPGVIEVKRRLENGAIAGPIKGLAWYTKGFLHNGSHLANLLEFWLGPIGKFSVFNAGRYFGEADREPDVQINFALGEVTFLAAREEYFSHHEIQLLASNGCLRYEQGGTKVSWQSVGPSPDFTDHNLLSLHREMIPTEDKRLQWHVTDHVSACLRGQSSSLCSGQDALCTLEALLEIRKAS